MASTSTWQERARNHNSTSPTTWFHESFLTWILVPFQIFRLLRVKLCTLLFFTVVSKETSTEFCDHFLAILWPFGCSHFTNRACKKWQQNCHKIAIKNRYILVRSNRPQHGGNKASKQRGKRGNLGSDVPSGSLWSWWSIVSHVPPNLARSTIVRLVLPLVG